MSSAKRLLILWLIASDLATIAALLVTGIGGHGTTGLVTTSVVNYFPSALRELHRSSQQGLGRIGIFAPYIADALLDAGMGTSCNFLMFAIGAIACLGIVIAAELNETSMQSWPLTGEPCPQS